MPEVNFLVKKGLTVPKGSAATPAVIFDASDSNTGIYSPGADQVAISTGGSGRLFVDASGRLGVGTSSPSFPIESKVTGLDSTIWGYNVAQFADATANNTGLRIGTNTSTSGLTQLIAATNSAASQFGFWTYNGSAWGERMRLDSSGRLGIGTTSPGHLLTVVASAGAQDIFLAAQNGISDGYRITSNGTALTHAWFNSASEAARIDTSGRLLVGTSSQSGGALLQVNGDRVRIATAKTPASATDTGTAGEICWDASYVYVCTATNTWKRSALSTW